MALGNGVDRCFIKLPEIALRLDDPVDQAFRQGLVILYSRTLARRIPRIVTDPATFHRFAIDMQYARDDLYFVAGQPDDTLDVVRFIVQWQFEDGDIAAFRLAFKDPAFEDRRAERQRMSAVTERIFGHEQIIADQEGRNHGSGRDIERFEQKGSNDDRKKHGVDYGTYGFAKGARFRFGL